MARAVDARHHAVHVDGLLDIENSHNHLKHFLDFPKNGIESYHFGRARPARSARRRAFCARGAAGERIGGGPRIGPVACGRERAHRESGASARRAPCCTGPRAASASRRTAKCSCRAPRRCGSRVGRARVGGKRADRTARAAARVDDRVVRLTACLAGDRRISAALSRRERGLAAHRPDGRSRRCGRRCRDPDRRAERFVAGRAGDWRSTVACCAARPAYLHAHGTPHHPSELAAHECMVLSGQRDWSFLTPAGPVSVRVDGRSRPQRRSDPRCLLAGLGIALKSTWDVAPLFAQRPARDRARQLSARGNGGDRGGLPEPRVRAAEDARVYRLSLPNGSATRRMGCRA